MEKAVVNIVLAVSMVMWLTVSVALASAMIDLYLEQNTANYLTVE